MCWTEGDGFSTSKVSVAALAKQEYAPAMSRQGDPF